jgi:hypothetical protein
VSGQEPSAIANEVAANMADLFSRVPQLVVWAGRSALHNTFAGIIPGGAGDPTGIPSKNIKMKSIG